MTTYHIGNSAFLTRPMIARHFDDPGQKRDTPAMTRVVIEQIRTTFFYEPETYDSPPGPEEMEYNFVPEHDLKKTVLVHWNSWMDLDAQPLIYPKVRSVCKVGQDPATQQTQVSESLEVGNIVRIMDILSASTRQSIAYSKGLRERNQAANTALYLVVKMKPTYDNYRVEKWVPGTHLQPDL
ncbi:hypothetical protein AMATHDRAFT_48251 [Amanita thiersii Skay4041]|uniref:Uncharacterized protein n=1 Tax=Amanita thiersii Skay4041 TaxID=703135 RepID=A0A2A9NQF2_9AGAR|nr:hypothetical protein AMATHDRAFT_48251 [Amanita thiersii Skay4041]